MHKGFIFLLPIIGLAVFLSYPGNARYFTAVKEVKESLPQEVVSPTLPVEEFGFEVSPAQVVQGEPVLVKLRGPKIQSAFYDDADLPVFELGDEQAVLIGVDLRARVGEHPLIFKTFDGEEFERSLNVKERVLKVEPLGIPETLGGNTKESTETLVKTLVEEGKIINAIGVSREKLWQEPFIYPLAGSVLVTDPYGYGRETNSTTLAHKGTDFRASVGTPVRAINAGRVAYVGYLRNYGNVVAIDHGANVLSLAMHLSKVNVASTQVVKRGEQIGLSGDTGYVLGPHLHLTIRVGGVSIDPEVFMKLLGEKN